MKCRIWIVLFARFSIHWNFKDAASFSLIRIWRKAFSMSANKIGVSNLVLIKVSRNLFWRDGLFSGKRIPILWFDRDMYYYQFVDSAFCQITGQCGWKNSFWIFLWFSETFSITLFTNWSLIIWSYAFKVSWFYSSCFKSGFRRPRLPDVLLFKGTLFSIRKRPASY